MAAVLHGGESATLGPAKKYGVKEEIVLDNTAGLCYNNEALFETAPRGHSSAG